MTGEQRLLLHMHELCTFLNQQGVSTFLILAQAGIFGSQMAPPVDVSYLADNVLLVRYFEFNGQVRKALSVVKKRAGEHEVRSGSFDSKTAPSARNTAIGVPRCSHRRARVHRLLIFARRIIDEQQRQ